MSELLRARSREGAHRAASRLGRWIRSAFAGIVGVYGLLAGVLYVEQSRLLYPAPPPQAVILREGERLKTLALGDGTVPLLLAGSDAAPPVVWFHGNGGQLSYILGTGRALVKQGLRVGIVEWPGYGMATAENPTEETLFAVARLAIDELSDRDSSPEGTVCVGHSLGTGVAAAMAAEGRCRALVLISPFTSMWAAAEEAYPFVPARWLLRDRYDTLARSSKITVPTLVIHGTQDGMIPISHGRQVAAAISGAVFVSREKGHNDIVDADTLRRVAELARRGAPAGH